MNDPIWYIVRILMKCSVPVPDEGELFSEEFLLMKGGSPDEVKIKAKAKGESMSHSYLNDVGDRVSWSFQSVIEVKESIDNELEDGAELYARLCSVPPEAV